MSMKHISNKRLKRRKKQYMNRYAGPAPSYHSLSTERHITFIQRCVRALKPGFGCLLTLLVSGAVLLVGGIAFGLLISYIYPLVPNTDWAVFIFEIVFGFGGVLLAVICVVTANGALRRLCQRLKRQHLQRHGIAVQAEMVHQEHIIALNPRGSNPHIFFLTLRWQHPETARTYEYTCNYVFLLFPKKDEEIFVNNYRAGTHHPLLFSPQHPWYYLLEIPYIPDWFDLLF
jgi:hypothetical protein